MVQCSYFLGIGRIVVHPLTVEVLAVVPDDPLSFIGRQEVDEFDCIGLGGSGALGLTETVIGVD